MSLQFIFGDSGSGKSYYLHRRVIRESMEDPQGNYIVLVPEQFTMQTQKDLVEAHPGKGIMNIDVLSFGRLAHRVFEEVGGSGRVVLDDVGKNFILRKIASECEGQLPALGRNIKKLGYISEVKSAISEFTQYDIQPGELDEVLGQLEDGSGFYYKLRDLKTLYTGFEDYLRGRFITGEEILDVLFEAADKSQLLKKSVIVLDGFTGFTPVQNKLLGKLMSVCRKVIVTVTIAPNEDPYVLRHKYQLFALSKQMVTSLVNIAAEHCIKIEDEVKLDAVPSYRYRKNPPLAFLESEIFRYSKKKYSGYTDALQIHNARNPYEEVTFIAEEIRRIVRTKRLKYREIAVVVCDMETYADTVEHVFSRYQIPVFSDYKRSVLLNSFVEYVRSLLSMAEQRFSYESVFRFLRTGLSCLAEDEIDRLENYVIALGIRGYKKWQEPWLRRMKGMTEEELSEINGYREKFAGMTEGFVKALRKRKKTVTDISGALYEFFVQENMQERVREQELHFKSQGNLTMEKEYAQVYRVVIDLLDRFVELLGEEELTLKEYCELLDAGLMEARIGVIPPSMDQVVAGDIERTRLKDIKVLFLAGVNDIFVPGNPGSQGILTEKDREALKNRKIVLAPGSKETVYIQKFYLYLHMTKPEDRLYLSYSKSSAQGKSLRPSYMIQEIHKMYPDIRVKEDEEKTLRERELMPETAVEFLIAGMKEKKGQPAWEELYTWYKGREEWKERIDQILQAAFMRCQDQSLTSQMAEKLYEQINTASVTRMEAFASCPYAHFLTYGLTLKERQEYEFQAMDLGNVFHRAMEHFSKKVEQNGYQWVRIPEDERNRFVEESVEESIADYENSVLYSNARNEYMIVRLTRMVNRTVWAVIKQLERGDFVPNGYEVNFGNGKIDRIDICENEDKVYVKIMDYKTGSKSFDITALYHGLQLQLVVYLDAALALEQKQYPGKEIIPAGIFYYQMKDPMVAKELDEKKLEEAILKELKLDGLVNSADDVIEHLDRGLIGSSLVVPAARNKDSSLSKTSRTATTEEFRVMADYASGSISKIKKEIRQGKVSVSPYEYGGKTGCDFCRYKNICGFDEKIEGYEYRRLTKLMQSEAIEKMRKEIE